MDQPRPSASAATSPLPPIAVPPMARFLENVGEPPIPWKRWLLIFENFWMMANAGRPDAQAYSPQQKSRYLLLMLGTEGLRLTADSPAVDQVDTLSHADFVKGLAQVFDPVTSPVRAISDFLLRHQRPGEPLEEWLADLRHLAVRCKFPDGQMDRRLAEQLATGAASEKAKERLHLLEELDLRRIREILLSDESLRRNMRQPDQLQSIRNPQFGTRPSQVPPPPSPTPAPCRNCGSTSHQPLSPACKALTIQCRTCQKVGHFAAWCPLNRKGAQGQASGRGGRGSRPGRRGGGPRGRQSTAPPGRQANALYATDPPEVIGQLDNGRQAGRIPVTLQLWTGLQWKPVEFEADSGAGPTTLRAADFKTLSPAIPLSPATPLLNYDRTPLKGVLGCLVTTLQLGERRAKGPIHIVPDHCSSVIGRGFLNPLQAVIHCGQQTVSTLFQGPRDHFPGLFQPTMGLFPGYQHRILLMQDARPTAAKLRGVPLARRADVEKEITRMDKEGVWEPVTRSEWIHGLVTVPKESGGVRITTDLSPLNQYVIAEAFPLPAIKDLLLELHGAKVFSKLDFRKGYFHVQLHPESRPLTTTITSKGLRQYTRLPMGLKESASTFQRLVHQTLAGLEGVVFYIDDILVFGRDRPEHDHRLKPVMERLQAANFRLNPEKCRFGVAQVEFLGYLIGADGVRPDPKNLRPILDCPQPHTTRAVQAFLGMVNFYQDFIHDVSSLAEPLRLLTRKAEPFRWGPEQQIAFQAIKEVLAKDLRVFLFDPAAPTTVTTDASDVGVGAVLSQRQGDKDVPIAFASATLNPTQRRYSASEREAWACVWALEKWEKYLLGRPFILRTDHSALQTLLSSHTSKRESSKFHRWLERLAVFDFTPEYLPGAANKVADALSRLVIRAEKLGVPTPPSNAVDEEDGHPADSPLLQSLTWKDYASATASDPHLGQVQKYMEDGWPKPAKLPGELRPYAKIKDTLTTARGCVVRDDGRLVVPEALRMELLKKAHEGHPGIVRFKRLLRTAAFWPGMAKQAEDLVRNCVSCQLSDKSTPTDQCRDKQITAPNRPAAQWGVDLAGPFHNGETLLVAVDYHSRWPEVVSRKRWSAMDVIQALADLFARYGLPDALVTDNGPQFASREFQDFLSQNDVHHYRAAVYNPQENGAVERFNRVLKTGIQAFHAEGKSWIQGLRSLLLAYRATPSEGGVSPAEKFLGHPIRMAFQPNPSPPLRMDTPQETPARSGIRPGDRVVTRLPATPKGLPAYSKPKTVEAVLGRHTLRLSDGQKWNTRKVKKMPESHQHHHFLPPVPLPAPAPPLLRRSQRERKGIPPARYPRDVPVQ